MIVRDAFVRVKGKNKNFFREGKYFGTTEDANKSLTTKHTKHTKAGGAP